MSITDLLLGRGARAELDRLRAQPSRSRPMRDPSEPITYNEDDVCTDGLVQIGSRPRRR